MRPAMKSKKTTKQHKYEFYSVKKGSTSRHLKHWTVGVGQDTAWSPST
jgi:hypothetical protein